ncbi:MAG: helicase-exonuclease AddAB subunit AddA [Intestinimonas sp.]|jgi:ATP-dependent helicase/nuclease subunit A|nr:helicase-exonuclease AddAB subunit AddA [Intestinimonas sp.]
MGFPLTEQQRAVVEDRGGGLLVSAAAGSGKTRVLVERLLARVDAGEDIDRFLVITYTKAAAAELRGRIIEELSQRLEERPDDRHLRRQAARVYGAQISTIHAFCAQMLRECGHLLDLDPDFRLCDEGEAGVLKLQMMDEVLEARYDAMDPESDFARLVDMMSAGRDDSRLIQIALDIYGRIQSHPAPTVWMAQQLSAFALEGVTDAGQTQWGRLLLEDARAQADYWEKQIARALELARSSEQLTSAYAPSLTDTWESLRTLSAATRAGWDAAWDHREVCFPRLGAVRGCTDPETQEQIKVIRDKCKKRMGRISEMLAEPSQILLTDMHLVYPAVQGLFALVEDFSTAYTEEKRRRGLLDFSDLEHGAVRLLTDEHGRASDLAQQWAARYNEVMVDEYQDTNEVQNAIFQAISHNGRTLFMVGDVKQSIYRFRLADPTIFMEKYRTFRPQREAEEGEPRRAVLTMNFRSRPQVLESTNDLFRALMSREFGEIDYTEDQRLYPGASFPTQEEGADPWALELDTIDLSGTVTEEGRNPPRDLAEGRFVARRIRELLDGGFQIQNENGGLRPVNPSDIVILLRSPGTVLHQYARALEEQGIPWTAEGGRDFFDSTEVSVALSMLEIMDNPRQDVPLLSVLRSPVCGFSADRLAQLRAKNREGDFYSALASGAERGEKDCLQFLGELSRLRARAGDLSCNQLLWQLYDRTNLLGIYSAMEGGETRRANLLALCACARQFEEAGHKGLFGFLSYLRRLRESGVNLESATGNQEGAQVRILSIHRSKGLEFPLVFLAGLARRLNREDMQKPMLFHQKLGVGPKGLDTERMVEFPTLARQAVARKLESEMMAEELRLLYVAMTRAQEKLILTCALTGGARDLQRLAGDAGFPVEPQALMATQSVAQWVLMAALARPDAGPLRQAAGVPVTVSAADYGSRWDVRWIDGGELARAPEKPTVPAPAETRGRGPDAEALLKQLSWRYPHQADVEIPSKLTATQLKGRTLDDEAAEQAPPPDRPFVLNRPRFAAEKMGLTAAQRGTALHLVMQYIDFSKTGSTAEVAEEIARLTRREILTPQQGEAADPARIAAFFCSDLGREMMASGTLEREFKFSILVPAQDYYPQAGEEEQVLLQGVVDCWFETESGITVVDFKTDRVSRNTMAARAAEYAPQMAVYSRALAEVVGRPVTRRVLWFFHADAAYGL